MGTQELVYNYLIGVAEPKTPFEITEALNREGDEHWEYKQITSACTNLSRRGVIEGIGTVHEGSATKAWRIVPGVPFNPGRRGGDTTQKRKPRLVSTHPGALRFRAAMDDMMTAFTEIEPFIVSQSDLTALEQFKAMAKKMAPGDEE